MRRRAEQRNRAMVERINAYLSPVVVDYDREVLPLTPAGNATERHMLAAYIQAAAEPFRRPAPFLGRKAADDARTGSRSNRGCAQIPEYRAFQVDETRRGWLYPAWSGYLSIRGRGEPAGDRLRRAALRYLAGWPFRRGTGRGRASDLLIDKGAVALNIVPDRNWNIPDPETRRVKVNNLYTVVALAEKLDLPLNIGTEMNALGQKLVDDFDAPELVPVRQAFLDGAYFIYGHTPLAASAGTGLPDNGRSSKSACSA